MIVIPKWMPAESAEDTAHKWAMQLIDYIDKKSQYIFTSITAFGKTIKLKNDLTAKLSKIDELYSMDNDYLDIHCIGDSESKVKQEFFEMFIADKENYYDCDESELSASGLEHRKKLSLYL